MSDIIARMRPVLDGKLSGLGKDQHLGQLDWDSLEWSSFILELFNGQDHRWRDSFFKMAFLENNLAQMNRTDLERILVESWHVSHQGS